MVGMIAILFFASQLGMAKETKDYTAAPTVTVTCERGGGTIVTFKSTGDVEELRVGSYCEKRGVPAGWTVQCYIGTNLDSVDVSFVLDGEERHTVAICT